MNNKALSDAFAELSRAAARVSAALAGSDFSPTIVEEKPEPTRPRKQKPLTIVPDEPAPPTKTSRKILVALAQVGRPMSAAQIGLFTGLAHKGGAFSKALTGLRADGLIEGGGAAMTITAAGRVELGEYAPLPTGHALFEFWCRKLGATAEKILRALRRSEGSMSSAGLGEATMLSHTGGAFAASLTTLRKMDLIVGGSSGMRLSPELLHAIAPTIGVFDKTSGNSVRVNREGHVHK